MVCDFHTHILPKMDDGAKDLDTSLALLKKEKEMGVKKICLTPHFYAAKESFEEFLERREKSAKILFAETENLFMDFHLGAEVFYYRGISENERLWDLKISGTDLLLMEMPFRTWTDYEVRELCDLARNKKATLCLAHFERYLGDNKDSVFEEILESGGILSSNASFFDGFFRRKKALEYFQKGTISILGSDTHNLEKRPPNLKFALETIEKKMGKETLGRFLESEAAFFGEKP